MWYREFKDYPPDSPLLHKKVEPGHGIIGCEMHELNGWGISLHQVRKRKKKGLIAFLVTHFLTNRFKSRNDRAE
ncbi:Uncharacterized protein PHSC3_000596 [Chlamydiales bacterium STE3]|nr:Uncharacterized protein PHSC3_000596 [Chlamydiales bacterium STE3]